MGSVPTFLCPLTMQRSSNRPYVLPAHLHEENNGYVWSGALVGSMVEEEIAKSVDSQCLLWLLELGLQLSLVRHLSLLELEES